MSRLVRVIIATSLCASCAAPELREFEGSTMGTYYRIKVVDDSGCQIKQESVDRFLALFNQSMSTYIKLSEISQFNQAPANKPIPVSPFLEKALVLSLIHI